MFEKTNFEGIFQKWVVLRYRSFIHGWKVQELGSVEMNTDEWNTVKETFGGINVSRGNVGG